MPDQSPKPEDTGVPQHVAIIMDGNGRWAAERHMPRMEGHRRGVKAVQKALKGAIECGVSYLTLYAFSTENWNRSTSEVSDLMGLLRFYLKNELKKLNQEGVRLLVIGDRSALADDIVDAIEKAEALTAGNKRITLVIALSYGGRQEIVAAARELSTQVASGAISAEDITETRFSAALYTSAIPDPDLLIRTSGEVRISNFLLWQLAYAEMVFLDEYWPDFNEAMFKRAIDSFKQRERRFGARA